MSHTESPWTTWFNYDDEGEIVAAGVDMGTPENRGPGIAEILCETVMLDGPEYNARIIADARLIAAAPDLLAALQALLHQVQQMRGMFPDEDGTIAAAIQDAEDAINQTRPTK